VRGTASGLVVILALALVAGPLAAEAQQAGKVYRIGILGQDADDPLEARLWQVFRLELRERGWIEGGNLLIESRWAGGNATRIAELAADLVRLKVDLIVTRGSIYAQGAKTATSSIPIVFTMHADPVGVGHVASLARPGGNITGLTIVMTETNLKGLQMLMSVLPKARRIGVLWQPDTPSVTPGLKALEEAARSRQLQLQPVRARTGADLEAAFAAMAHAKAQAVLVLGAGIYIVERQQIAELAIKYRLPTFFNLRDHAEAGGLLSYGPDFSDLVRRGAIFADKILRGTKTADLPVEQATKFELVINMKTAKALGLTIQPSLLLQADQVIE
jgi:putative ABC transport system substrate-binding protein